MNVKRLLVSLSEHFATHHVSRTAAVSPGPALGHGAFALSCEHKQIVSDSEDEVESEPKIAGKWLAQDKKLLEKIAMLLKHQNPPVTDLTSASQGFRDLGQFIAAVDISHNLGVPFERIKRQIRMTETPAEPPASLSRTGVDNVSENAKGVWVTHVRI